MTKTEATSVADALASLEAAISGEASWQANLGHGTSATLDFRERLVPLDPGGPPRGSVHLWISGAAWRIDRNRKVVTGSDDIGSKMADSLRELEGLRVESVRLPESTLDLSLEFEGAVVLRTFRHSTEEDPSQCNRNSASAFQYARY